MHVLLFLQFRCLGKQLIQLVGWRWRFGDSRHFVLGLLAFLMFLESLLLLLGECDGKSTCSCIGFFG